MEEYICDECNGTGKIDETKIGKNNNIWLCCKKCNGEGKLNWLENIFGKQHLGFHYTTFTAPVILHPYPPINIVGS